MGEGRSFSSRSRSFAGNSRAAAALLRQRTRNWPGLCRQRKRRTADNSCWSNSRQGVTATPVVAATKGPRRGSRVMSSRPPGRHAREVVRTFHAPSRSAGRLLIGPSVDRFFCSLRGRVQRRAIAVDALGRWIRMGRSGLPASSKGGRWPRPCRELPEETPAARHCRAFGDRVDLAAWIVNRIHRFDRHLAAGTRSALLGRDLRSTIPPTSRPMSSCSGAWAR